MIDFRRALGTALRNMLINAALAAGKLLVGVLAHSQALLSDGVHGAVDTVSGAAVMIGLRLSAKRADARHPYGYERMECVAALLLSLMIGATGIGLAVAGIQALVHPAAVTASGAVALAAATVSLLVKEWMFRRTRRDAEAMASPALMADAWHQRTDVAASLGALAGVAATALGWQAADALTACAISVCIVRAAVMIFADAVRNMTDHAADAETERHIASVAEACHGVCRVCGVRTRLFGSRVMAEVTVGVDGTLSAEEAYAVRCGAQNAVEQEIPRIKECFVSIRPFAVANRA